MFFKFFRVEGAQKGTGVKKIFQKNIDFLVLEVIMQPPKHTSGCCTITSKAKKINVFWNFFFTQLQVPGINFFSKNIDFSLWGKQYIWPESSGLEGVADFLVGSITS